MAEPASIWRASGCLLECDFSEQTLQIAVNDRNGQRLIIAAIADRAVLRDSVQLPVDVGIVPMLGVTDIREAEIVLLGPEKWNGVKPLLPS